MREVNRLADRIVLVWIQLEGITLADWRRLPLDSRERQQALVEERLVHVNPGDIDQDDPATIEQFRPSGDGWYCRGARGWVGPGTGRVMSFSTDSFDLEPGDVCIDNDRVLWVAEGTNEMQAASVSQMDIVRDARTQRITEVKRR